MTSVWLSLVVLLLASSVAADNLWERDENNYNEVMKNLEKENPEVKKEQMDEAEEEQKEEKRGNVEYLSTYFTTQYQTWCTSGESTVNGKTNEWTSTYISSWVNTHIKTFHTNELVPGFTSYTTSFSTKVVQLKPTIVVETHSHDNSNAGDGWFTEFKVENCDCKEKFLEADRWMSGQLKLWTAATKPLRKQAKAWFKKNKRVGKWWIQETNDDRFEQWRKWAHYLETMRAKHLSLGAKKFKQTYQPQVKVTLKKMISQLGNSLSGRVKEGNRIASFKRIPQFTYKSQVFSRYALDRANVWRRTEIAKFGAFFLRLYRGAQSWYKSQRRPEVKKLWKSYKETYLSFYKDFINLMKPWYASLVNSKDERSIKYMRNKWKLFIQPFYAKLQSFFRAGLRKLSTVVRITKPGFLAGPKAKQNLRKWLVEKKRNLNKLSHSMTRKVAKLAKKVSLLSKKKMQQFIQILSKERHPISKFSKKVCGCDKKSLSANDWVGAQLKYWDAAVRPIQKQINEWFAKNKNVGRWWILLIQDDISQIWIQWTKYLEQMRTKHIKLGSIAFSEKFNNGIDDKLYLLLKKLRSRLTAHIDKGVKVLQSLKKKTSEKKVKTVLKYKPRFKKTYKRLSAKIWRRAEDAKIKAIISTLRTSAKSWAEENGLKVKWWKRFHEKILNVAYEQYQGLLNVFHKEIQHHGYIWYKKYGEQKWKSVLKLVHARVKPLNKKVFAKSQVIIDIEARRTPPAIKSKVIKAMKRLITGLKLHGHQMKRKLENIAQKGTFLYIMVVEKPTEKAQKKEEWTLAVRTPLPTKFKIKTCECDPLTLSSHEWMAGQIIRWEETVSKLKKKIYNWFLKNRSIGKWWLLESKDDFYEAWIKWVWYLDNIRKMRILLGTALFHKNFDGPIQRKLNLFVGELERRLSAQIEDGKEAHKWRKHPVYKDKLALLEKFTPRFKKSYRMISANLWMRRELGRFGAYLSRLYRSGKDWIRRHPSATLFWWSNYRELINLIYRRYNRLLRIYFRGIRSHGYTWHVKINNHKWRTVKRALLRRVKNLHKDLLTRSSSLLARIQNFSPKALKVLLQNEFFHHFGAFNEFISKTENEIRGLLRKDWIVRIVGESLKPRRDHHQRV
jgi:hypothetical protein